VAVGGKVGVEGGSGGPLEGGHVTNAFSNAAASGAAGSPPPPPPPRLMLRVCRGVVRYAALSPRA